MKQVSLRLSPMIAFVLILAGCSGAGAESGISSERVAQVKQICMDVMNLSPGEAHFMGCVESLQQTLVRIDQAEALQRDREICRERGLGPGTAAFATCVVGLGQAPTKTEVTGHAL